MSKRGNSVHVVTTTRKYKDRVYKTHLLRHTYREDGKVKNETVGNLSHLPDDVIELIRRALRGESLVNPDAVFQILRSRAHGHVLAVLGMIESLGVDRMLSARRCIERDRCVALIAARILTPGSKRATSRHLDPVTATSTLGAQLQLDSVEAEDLYAAMDWLLPRQPAIEKALARKHLQDGTLVLYDVSSSYFEGEHCPLARRGYSRDGKKGTLQIVYGLLCNAQGCPVAIEVYPGNTADPKTLSDQIRKVRERFGLTRVVFVADRGLLTSARINEELRGVEGLDWISALRSEQVRKLLQPAGPLQPSLFDTTDLAEFRHPDFPGERLVACMNPLLRDKRAYKREALLQASEVELDKVVRATQRSSRALRGQDRIGLRVGKVLSRFNMAKHFDLTITDRSFAYQRKQDAIEAEARLDGIYVVRTSVSDQVLDCGSAVLAYKQLAVVERAFRSLKTVDLHIRPIYHRLTDRVRAHVFLCMLAYYVEWHLRRAWAPLLFAEDDWVDAQALRGSPVQPAMASRSAKRKANTGRTADDLPVHHFGGLLDQLATLARHTVRPTDGLPTFEQITQPNALQKRAFQLINVKIRV